MERRQVLEGPGAAALPYADSADQPAAARRSLSAHEAALVRAIAAAIAPRPSASAAGRVDELVDQLLADWCPPAERARVRAGLAAIDERGRAAGGRGFLALDTAERRALLRALDAERDPDGAAHAYGLVEHLAVCGAAGATRMAATVRAPHRTHRHPETRA